MTEPRHDELASAWLDGELDGAERAALDRDPATRDAVERARRELAAARSALAAPVGVPEGLTDDQIARAVELGLDAASAGTGGVVVDLGARRARSPRPRSWLVSRAAAAVLVVGGLGIGVAAVLDDPAPRDDVALTASSSQQAERSAEAGAADAAGGRAEPADGEAAGDAAAPDGASALAAPESSGDAEGSDTAGRAEEGSAGGSLGATPGVLSSSAQELLAGGPLDAGGLRDALVARHGPVATWPIEASAPDSCRPRLEAADPGSVAAVVAVDRADEPLELVLPAAGDPYLVRRGSCDRIS